MRGFSVSLAVCALLLSLCGCGTFVANRLTQAPNSYPSYLTPKGSITIAPKPRVSLAYDPGAITNFHRQYLRVGPPDARLCYRVVEPGDFHLKTSVSNWVEGGKQHFDFEFVTAKKMTTNHWTASPRGTVVLLHGYGLAQFSMVPWAILLAQEGWRCVLVDLRGHGQSTGDKIYFGLVETMDLSALLDRLDADHRLARPLAVVGESYGASLALRWKTQEPRIGPVVAIAPYGVLSNAVMNIASDYVPWIPKWMLRAGIRKLPSALGAGPEDLDITGLLRKNRVRALFIAGGDDDVMTESEVGALCRLAGNGSRLVVQPGATHEAVSYFFGTLGPAVNGWLQTNSDLAAGVSPGPVLTSGAIKDPP